MGVAVIGCGDMGQKHARAWAARNDSKVVAVCDLDPVRASTLAEVCSARAYTFWQDAIAHDAVDVVSVCTPACFHRDMSVTAAMANRHVLCEKPMALTLDEADDMIAAARTHSVQLLVSHQYRGLSRYRIIKQLIDEGTLGAPLYLRFMEMREVRPKLAMHMKGVSGGPVHDMIGHLIDLARFFTGAEVESVVANGDVFGRGKDRLATIDAFGTDVAEIQMRLSGGHCLSIGINWGLPENTPSHSAETISGPLGIAYTEDRTHPDLNLAETSETTEVVLKSGAGTRRIPCDPDPPGPEHSIARLSAAIDGDGRHLGKDGRAALVAILGALRSVESRETVILAGT